MPGDRSNPPVTVHRNPKRFQQNCHHKKCPLNNSRKSNDHIEARIKTEARDCEKKPVPSNRKSLEKEIIPLCELCGAKFKSSGHPQASLSDEEARRMYKKYKLYAIPSEMKFPPSFGSLFETLLGLVGPLFNRAHF